MSAQPAPVDALQRVCSLQRPQVSFGLCRTPGRLVESEALLQYEGEEGRSVPWRVMLRHTLLRAPMRFWESLSVVDKPVSPPPSPMCFIWASPSAGSG